LRNAQMLSQKMCEGCSRKILVRDALVDGRYP
jgi:hypothetical protein